MQEKERKEEAAWLVWDDQGNLGYFEARLTDDEASPTGQGWYHSFYEVDRERAAIFEHDGGMYWDYESAEELECEIGGYLPSNFDDHFHSAEVDHLYFDALWEESYGDPQRDDQGFPFRAFIIQRDVQRLCPEFSLDVFSATARLAELKDRIISIANEVTHDTFRDVMTFERACGLLKDSVYPVEAQDLLEQVELFEERARRQSEGSNLEDRCAQAVSAVEDLTPGSVPSPSQEDPSL